MVWILFILRGECISCLFTNKIRLTIIFLYFNLALLFSKSVSFSLTLLIPCFFFIFLLFLFFLFFIFLFLIFLFLFLLVEVVVVFFFFFFFSLVSPSSSYSPSLPYFSFTLKVNNVIIYPDCGLNICRDRWKRNSCLSFKRKHTDLAITEKKFRIEKGSVSTP